MAKQRILLVDDEPRVTRLMRMHLESTGAYEVKEENSGSRALAAARQFRPDFILLDVVMPDMDGGEIAGAIAADESLKNIPLVFLTATVSKEEQGIIAGYPFLAKPASGAQIIECIQQYLGPMPGPGSQPDVAASAGAPPPDWNIQRFYGATLVAVALAGVGYLAYWAFTRSQQSQQATIRELQDTKKEISSLRSSTSEAVRMQQRTIDEQQKSMADDTLTLNKMKAIENRLEETLQAVEETKISILRSAGVSPALLTSIAPSVVKLYCLSNSYSDNVQKGSGFLYRGSRNNPRLPLYYVQTNLHVIKMEDRADADCRILVYPDYTDSSTYLLFKSRGYQSYGDTIDIAYLDPRIVNDLKAGTGNDLMVYARDETVAPACDPTNIGDHLSIFGYPGVGGETLTVTEGIVSGFEIEERKRYVKTSAKIDHGNSGGVAIKDSGCVVGIPTWSRSGKVESIGRILDLNYLRNETLKYVTLR